LNCNKNKNKLKLKLKLKLSNTKHYSDKMQTRSQSVSLMTRSIEREQSRIKRMRDDHSRRTMERSKMREQNRIKNLPTVKMSAEDVFRENMMKLVNEDRSRKAPTQSFAEKIRNAREIGIRNNNFVKTLNCIMDYIGLPLDNEGQTARERNIVHILEFFKKINEGIEEFIFSKLAMGADEEKIFEFIVVIHEKIFELESNLTHRDGELEITMRREMNKTKKIIEPVIREVTEETSFVNETLKQRILECKTRCENYM